MPKPDKFIELLRTHSIKPTVIFDIGSFDGSEAICLAKAFPDAKVYSFECDPANIAKAYDNLLQHPEITFIPIGIGRKTMLSNFNAPAGKNKECGSFLVPNGSYYDPMPVHNTIVPVYNIKDLTMERKDVINPDVIWMDVQGYELDVLDGAMWLIDAIKAIWLEVAETRYYESQPLIEDVDKYCLKKGYTKIYYEECIKGWFGNACYIRKV